MRFAYGLEFSERLITSFSMIGIGHSDTSKNDVLCRQPCVASQFSINSATIGTNRRKDNPPRGKLQFHQ